jgi:hypothetical protein
MLFDLRLVMPMAVLLSRTWAAAHFGESYA